MTEALVEKVAEAVYQAAVDRARREIEKFQYAFADLIDLSARLSSESETAQVLIFYSYLDDSIFQILKLHLHHLESRASESKLFGMNGPLSTFSSRVLLAYHLGWLSQKQKNKLDAFRSVRNEFAHRAFKVTTSDEAVSKHLAALRFDLSHIRSQFSEDIVAHCDFNRLLCSLIMLAHYTLEELILLPVAKAHNVSPRDLAGRYEDVTGIRRDLVLSVSESILVAAGFEPRNGNGSPQ